MKTKRGYAVGSGNVFADIGLPGAEERQRKSELARQIGRILSDRGLTQIAAGRLLGIDQPKVSRLIRGQLAEFSTDRLLKFLNDLGADVEIRLKVKRHAKSRGHTQVVQA